MRMKKPVVGRHILDVLTSGMYNDPRMVVREYIQNAADAIDAANAAGDGCIQVRIDGKARTLCIEDNGTGVPESDIAQVLCSIGCSTKQQGNSRGFRGIGRLGGLGYCTALLFETRAAASDTVSTVRWDAREVGRYLSSGRDLHMPELLAAAVQFTTRAAEKGDPHHFFRITMHDVRRFHKDVLMDVTSIRSYLSQVAPVSYDKAGFRFAADIEHHLAGVDGFRQYHVFCNGEAVLKPHSTAFQVAEAVSDQIKGIELVELHGPAGEDLGRGWFAKSGFFGALPVAIQMRGIRVRQGNIEVGDEYFLADCFTERRFATWHIGEMHLNYAAKPNARRDGFEHTPEYEKFLEQTNLLGKHLSQVSRASSRRRSALKAEERHAHEVEGFLNTAFFLDEAHFDQEHEAVSGLLQRLAPKDADAKKGERYRRLFSRLESMREAPPLLRDALDHASLQKKQASDVLHDICAWMVSRDRDRATMRCLVQEALQPYLRPASRRDAER